MTALNAAWIKAHWHYVVAGLFGVFVLYELSKSLGASRSPAGGPDVSGGADQLQSLSAAADLQNAQVNGQVQQSAYAATVADNQIAASLELGKTQTAAQLEATNLQTEATREVNLAAIQGAVDTQAIQASAAITEAKIQSSTVEQLAATAIKVPLAQIAVVGKQVDNIMTYSKHAGSDYQAFAPILALETGQGYAAPGIEASVAAAGASKTQSIVGGITGVFSSLMKGLFGSK